ncbi:uncharacterized protein [Anoplolepis gracilipes]|uniref:uncharacterized protein n=1 Tax=Anoplolepis gracilipes TaxID=354296 RepID=UPI003BA353B0
MHTITCLPDELIVVILEDSNMTIGDIMKFTSTCKRFHRILLNDKFWEKKFYQRYSCAKKKCNTKGRKSQKESSYLKQLIKCFECVIDLQSFVSLMSNNNSLWSNTKEKKLECLLRSIAENSNLYCLVVYELNKIISAQLPSQFDSKLSDRYNLHLIYHCLKQYRFIYQQNQFMKLPLKKQLLEKQLIIVIKYFQPYVSYSGIKKWLDDITEEILLRLREKYPRHSIFSLPHKQISFWKNSNIDANFWSKTEAVQIMRILENFMFSEYGVFKLHMIFEILELEDKYTAYLLDHILLYLLTNMYQSVARRLGISCAITFIDEGFGIAWKPKSNREGPNATVLVDYFHMDGDSDLLCPSRISRGESFADSLQTLNELWVTKLISNFYEMINTCEVEGHCNILFKWKKNFLFDFLTHYIGQENINIKKTYKSIINSIKITSNIEIRKNPKKRNEKIKFAIGMIITHSSQPYLLTEKNNNHYGVIIGWHFQCKLSSVQRSLSSIIPHLNNCEHQHTCLCECRSFCKTRIIYQPHYIILTENNKLCYAPQDTVSMCPPKRINNVEIGRYFSKFEGTHYIPNESLAKNYPNDTDAILEILSNQ